MKEITVNTTKPYRVYVGEGLLDRAGDFVREVSGADKALIVSDSRVVPLYAARVEGSLRKSGFDVSLFAFEEGEASKNKDTLFSILEYASAFGMTRKDVFVALGGGVVGDVAGLAASLYMRGVDVVQFPTTLLAAVDSSVGGKTAIDLEAGKNLCGAFWQPSAVVCDVLTLDTREDNVFRCGMAEVIKYGAIGDPELFAAVADGIAIDREYVIDRCVKAKASIVSRDEFDKGERAALNFGHTFGHAIEKLSDFSISHGSAVAVGMRIAADVSVELGICSPADAQMLIDAIVSNGLGIDCPFDPVEIARAALSDKKKAGDTVSLVLIERIGKSVIHPVGTADLYDLCGKVIHECSFRFVRQDSPV